MPTTPRSVLLSICVAVSSAPLLLVAGHSAAGQPPAPAIDEIVRRHVRARGGLQRLEAIRTLIASGRLVSGAGESTFTLLWHRPDEARLELVTGRRTMIEVVSGDHAWWVSPDREAPQSGLLPVEAAREIADRADIDGILVRHRERGYVATVAGNGELDGQRVVTVRLERAGGESHVLAVSLASHLVLRRTSRWGGGGQGVEVEARFSDFRAVDGIVIPFTMERRAGGEPLHRVAVESVRLNPPLDPTAFAPPPDLPAQRQSP